MRCDRNAEASSPCASVWEFSTRVNKVLLSHEVALDPDRESKNLKKIPPPPKKTLPNSKGRVTSSLTGVKAKVGSVETM